MRFFHYFVNKWWIIIFVKGTIGISLVNPVFILNFNLYKIAVSILLKLFFLEGSEGQALYEGHSPVLLQIR